MNITTCRRCSARIFFAATVNGKDMPMDEKPVGKASVLKANPADPSKPMVKIVDNYQSHFVSCSAPEQFRKTKTKSAEPDSTEEETT